jgi:hypothetical protein
MDFGCNFIIVLLLEMTVVVEVPERKSQAFGSSCVELS